MGVNVALVSYVVIECVLYYKLWYNVYYKAYRVVVIVDFDPGFEFGSY